MKRISIDDRIIFFSIVMLVSFSVSELVRASNSNLVFDHNEYFIDHACTYYRVENTGSKTFTENKLKSINTNRNMIFNLWNGYRMGVKDVIGKTSNGKWEYQHIENYDCSETVREYKSCYYSGNEDEPNICPNEYEEVLKEKTCSQETWISPKDKKISNVKIEPSTNGMVRYCADVDLEKDINGWSIKSDHIPVFDGISYDEYAWWDTSWMYRAEVEITPVYTGREYIDYPMRINVSVDNLIAAGKLQNDLDDLRMTDDSDTEIPMLWIRTDNNVNASIWFNFTSTDASAKTYYLYYGNSGTDNTTTYVMNDFVGDGWEFDNYAAAAQPTDWAANTLTTGNFYDSGAIDGHESSNKSVTFSAENINQQLRGAYTNFTIEFSVELANVGNTVMFVADDAAQTEKGALLQVIGGNLQYSEVGGDTTIEVAQFGVRYFFRIEGDTIDDSWNLTVDRDNGAAKYRYTGLDFKADIAPVERLYRFSTGNNYYDDFVIINTSAWSEPSFLIGVEEIAAIGVTIQSPLNITYNSTTINVTAVPSSSTTMKFSINLGANQTLCAAACSSGEVLTSTDVVEGGNNITVYAESDGALGGGEESIFFTVDITKPNVKIDDPSELFRTNTSIPINYVATDNLILDQCQYQLNESSPTNVSLAACANTTLPQDSIGYAGGWEIEIFANDTAGNENSTSSDFSYWPLQNVSLLDSVTGLPISTFQLIISESGGSWSTTNETLNIPFNEIGIGERTLRFIASGYNSTEFTVVFNASSKINQTFQMTPSLIEVNVFDEEDFAQDIETPIIFNITFLNTTISKTFLNQLTLQQFTNNTTTGVSRLDISATGYQSRQLIQSIESDSALNITAFLIKTEDSIVVRFHILTVVERGIEGATVTVSRFLGEGFAAIGIVTTDESGTATFYLSPTAIYQIDISATGFQDRSLLIQPSNSDFTIHLVGTDVDTPTSNPMTNVTMTHTPTDLSINATDTNFRCLVISNAADLVFVGMNISNPNNGTVYYSNVTSVTSELDLNFGMDLTFENNTNITSDCFFRKAGFDPFNSTKTYAIVNITGSDLDRLGTVGKGALTQVATVILCSVIVIAIMGFVGRVSGNFFVASGVGYVVLGFLNVVFQFLDWRVYILIGMTYVSTLILRGGF